MARRSGRSDFSSPPIFFTSSKVTSTAARALVMMRACRRTCSSSR